MENNAILKIDSGGTPYNVLECEYEFIQPIKENGQPSARPAGGLMHFVIVSPDDNDIRFHEWMFDKTELKEGEFTFDIPANGKMSKKTISFKNAYCIRLYEYFNSANNTQMYMKITISASEINFGSNDNQVIFKNDGKS
jgi:hypothetical protein